MKTRHARSIGAFRSSGLNPRPVPPEPPDGTQGQTVTLGTSRSSLRVQTRVDAAQGVTLTDPPRVSAGTPLVGVRLDGVEARVPLGWGIAVSSARGRDALYLREPSGTLHVLVVSADGEIRELAGIPADLVADLLAQHFPGAGR